MEMLDDYLLSKEVQNRMKENFTPIKVSLDELWFRIFKEWNDLGTTIKEQFKKKLKQRLENPKVPKDKLSGFESVYKIRLKTAGYRLAYEAEDEAIVILVLAIGKRENNKVYNLLHSRTPRRGLHPAWAFIHRLYKYLLEYLLCQCPAVFFGIEHDDQAVFSLFFRTGDEACSRFGGISRFDPYRVLVPV